MCKRIYQAQPRSPDILYTFGGDRSTSLDIRTLEVYLVNKIIINNKWLSSGGINGPMNNLPIEKWDDSWNYDAYENRFVMLQRQRTVRVSSERSSFKLLDKRQHHCAALHNCASQPAQWKLQQLLMGGQACKYHHVCLVSILLLPRYEHWR